MNQNVQYNRVKLGWVTNHMIKQRTSLAMSMLRLPAHVSHSLLALHVI